MKFVVTYKVWDIPFTYETKNLFELYNAVTAIIKSNKLICPDQETWLNEYFKICADLENGKKLMHENHFFRVERIEEEKEEK